MARKGIPRGLKFQRYWFWHVVGTASDEYFRVTWYISLPFVGSLVWHRPKLCSDCMMCDYMNAYYFGSRHEAHARQIRARGRLYAMWDLGYRATEKR